MLGTTLDAFGALLRTDPTIDPPSRKAILRVLREYPKQPDPLPAPASETGPMIVTRKEAARLLCRSPRLIDKLAKAGSLRRVHLPGRQRAAGFTVASLQAIIKGGEEAMPG